jgi:hypothetical protein
LWQVSAAFGKHSPYVEKNMLERVRTGAISFVERAENVC